MDLTTRLRDMRERAGMSAAQLASAADVTVGYIHQLERGDRGERLAAGVALKIARALGVSVEELIDPAADVENLTPSPVEGAA
jgi:transcriptional regulator with XRE-family HTH domain